jgi:preprotein translocase subunit SecE
MKYPNLKKTIIVVVFFLGDFLVVFFGGPDYIDLLISAIPLYVLYPLIRFWVSKEHAKKYGIALLIFLAAMAILYYLIIPNIV